MSNDSWGLKKKSFSEEYCQIILLNNIKLFLQLIISQEHFHKCGSFAVYLIYLILDGFKFYNIIIIFSTVSLFIAHSYFFHSCVVFWLLSISTVSLFM